ncbi:CHY zinc finger protein [Lactobacillaceae bacterium Melli_B4]
MSLIYGIDLDNDGRCTHYHSALDVVALKCAQCQSYYACYQCHDELVDHQFVGSDSTKGHPVMCGHCRKQLTYEQYQLGKCVFCQHPFNPRCKLHQHIYFN